MRVHTSNRLERLAQRLGELLREPASAAWPPEVIVVPSRGVERWLVQTLADALGALVHVELPFPRRFVEQAFDAVLGRDDRPGTDRASLAWHIAARLPPRLGHPAFADLRQYLTGDDDGVRLVQVAGRIAEVFDRYAVFRPELALSFSRGGDDDWQAILWRDLADVGVARLPTRWRDFIARCQGLTTRPESLPARVFVFGVASLPPLYVTALAALSPVVDVHLFALTPTREFWGDLRRKSGDGHPLLASLGRLGREFQEVLLNASLELEEEDLFVDPGERALLSSLQSDLLHVRGRFAGGEAPPHALRPEDLSISGHACHGPMREVEVLKDRILGAFAADPTLTPADVAILTPDIARFGPLLEAAFGDDIRIADRRAAASEPFHRAFFRLVEVSAGRLTASDVLDVLALPPIMRRLGLTDEDHVRLSALVGEARVRWGADAGHLATLGLPGVGENTWRFGLDRVLLGYALPFADSAVAAESNGLFGGVLPYADVEGPDRERLGALATALSALTALRAALARPSSVQETCERLATAARDLLNADPDDPAPFVALHAALSGVARSAARAGFTQPVAARVVTAAVEGALSEADDGRALLTGALTGCAFLPLRSLPFRIVALLGLSDGAFPRTPHEAPFDRIAESPLPGDRPAREEDRYLLLEALLSARDRLLITWTGRSVNDNGHRPPSVLVDALFDVLASSCADPEAARRQLIVEHPLPAFSARAFAVGGDPRLASFDPEHCAGAVRAQQPRTPPPPFFAQPLPDVEPSTLSLDELLTFLSNPARWLLRARLELDLRGPESALDDREPDALGGLDRFNLGQSLLERTLRTGEPPRSTLARFQASGLLAPGAPGAADHARVAAEVEALAAEIRGAVRGPVRAPPRPFELTVGGHRLTGVLRDAMGQDAWRYGRLRGHDELGLWVRHLVAASLGETREARLVGLGEGREPKRLAYAPPAEPGAHLGALLELFERGRRAPLPFFPDEARTYVEALRKPNATPSSARRAAEAAFDPSFPGRPSTASDPYIQLAFRGQAPIGPAFEAAARVAFEPLVEHRA